ncbi:Putative Pol polyprotein, partial [Nipponia nippon]
WPLTQDKLTAAQEIINQELKAGHLEPSTSPWNTPIFVIKKKDKSKFRLLHDLRKVNEQMINMGPLQPGLPLPSAIPENWPAIVIDIANCFFSIPVAPQDRHRFAFTLPSTNLMEPSQRFQWIVLPQGMKNSPTICQIVVGAVLKTVRQEFKKGLIIHYMDDILLAMPQREELQNLYHRTTEVLTKAGFTIQQAKVQMGTKLQYLGTNILPQAITPLPITIKKEISTLHEAQQLVGAIQWIRGILGISPDVMKPLYELL